ncbi:transient-receptor-potential-like protein [Saccoglossus kowalevskii]|uniref:Transient-receptor-potential-like protein-like n=1 Tax=Saccoglossus kowalevskii TaxID=10224 RepID=A0ABM0GNC6_SACKO|nr:PREDICTED: transient-receptor-potential-like protein-like [Saccoglossus kowalevskii]
MMELSSSTLELVTPPTRGDSPMMFPRNANYQNRGVASGLLNAAFTQRRSASVISGVSSIPLQLFSEGNRLTAKERMFMEAAEKGDNATIQKCLKHPDPVNVNVTNILGRSALQISVDNENIEIVELLLAQPNVKIGDALLYAIREGVYKMVEMMVNHPSISREMLGGEWSKMTKDPQEESSDYSPDISPVILAAHCNQFEILQLLLTRGATISTPHNVTCGCEHCTEKQHEDSLRHSLHRINTYKALASPAWISLTSSDPILTAFKLSWELEHLAMRENEFKDVYQQLSHQSKTYAVDLLEQCRSSEEVIAVLNRDNDSEDGFAEEDVMGGKITLIRLKLALKFEQKRFVAHAHTQQLLTSIWYEGLPGWRKHNAFVKLLICLAVILLLPLMALCYLLFPHTKIGQLLRTPFMKFMNHSISFGFFLLLLVLASTVRFEGTRPASPSDTWVDSPRGREPNFIEVLIALWVFGFIWGECKQLWEEGLKAYIRQWWNWLDFIMLSLYLCTISLRFTAWWLKKSGTYPSFTDGEVQRATWPGDDPTLISEGVFAVANVFSFFRIIYLFQANPYLGPLQISLGCMLIDIAKFLFIFFLVLLSFACGLNQLYWYYGSSSPVHSQDADCPSNSNPDAFLSLDRSMQTLFWALFGLVGTDVIKLPTQGHNYTEFVGEILFACYHVVAIIVLLNMLIAMMSKSYQEIEDHADREWKFARTKLWMSYFDEGSTLPPPFNLIISPKSMVCFFKAIQRIMCGSCEKTKSRPQRQSLEGTIKKTHLNSDGVIGPPLQENIKYQDVMKRLVSRYIHQQKAEQKQDGVNEDDLNEIKQDISSLRYELRADRKKEQMRGTSQIENVKHEIIGELRGISGAPENESTTIVGAPRRSLSTVNPPSFISQSFDKSELESLKDDLIHTIRSEIKEELQESLRRALNSAAQESSVNGLLPTSSDLYHTHLYTQL